MMKTFMKYVSCYCVVAVFVMGIVPRVYAGFSPSGVIAFSEFNRSADLGKIQKVLETKMIRERLERLGFSQNEIQSRLGQLSDEQIHQFALDLDELKVAGNGEGFAIVLLIIALIVVLVLWLGGYKIVKTK